MKSRIWMWTTVVYLFAALAIPAWTAAQDNPSQPHKPKHKQYRLIDIGTLGGPTSYNSAQGVGSIFLTNGGKVAGYADTSTPDPYSPYCFNADCFVSHAFRWHDGVLSDLGVLPGGSSSAITAINKRGWVSGFSQNGVIDPLTGFPEGNAVLWEGDHMLNFGTLGGYESSTNYVNDDGQVVGFATINASPDPYSFLGAPTHGFIWRNGVMQDLGTLGGPDSFPGSGGVNQRNGLVAGSSFTNDIPNPTTGLPTMDPFLWKDGHMLDLGTLGGTLCCQLGTVIANNKGQVVGESNLAGDLTFHPFFWDGQVLRDLGTLGGSFGRAIWITDDEEIIGNADLPVSGHDGFLWKNGVMTDLGNLGMTSAAQAINSKGQIVGNSKIDSSTTHPFLWESGGPIVDLNTLLPANSALELATAENINERGWIAGVGAPAGCTTTDAFNGLCGHAYVLIPDGDCDDDCEGRIVASQNSAAQYPAVTKQEVESPTETINQLRNSLTQRKRLPGQRSAPSD